MYLKALEIHGFKSFPDHTVLTFGEDITAIVGPNGSGKSNIADAILWVMGEQSTRTLRGGKMEDVIFGGTELRRQMGFAEVSLILDNTKHFFECPQSELMVTRRYYRSGESEYFINKTSCRLKDVNELFMDTGMGRDGYSIIGQGKVDAVLSAKSAERREIFEEAAGISRYRHRKEEAERKLARTADNLLRISDKIEELEMQVEPLREQSEKAKQFLSCRDELRSLEISVWMDQLDRLRENNRKLLSDYENAICDRDEASAVREELYRSSEELGEQMQQLERNLESLRMDVAALDETAALLESEIAVLRTDAENNRVNKERLQRETELQSGREDSLSAQIEEREKRLSEIAGRQADLDIELSRRESETEEMNRSAGVLAGELEDLRQQEKLRTASAADAKTLLSALTASEQEMINRDSALAASEQEMQKKFDEAEQTVREKRRELEAKCEEKESAANVIHGYELRGQSRQKKLDEANDRVMQLTMEEHALSSRIHMLSEMEKTYEGYSKAVKNVLKGTEQGRLSGIRGPVAGLLRVPDRCTVAIEIALGAAMQNIVVERETDGKAAIEFLKRQDAGRATFLPMDALHANAISEKGLERQPGFVGIASELISYDAQYQNVFANLLGRVIVAEDMDAAIGIARAYHHRYRIVTLDGQVLNAGGSMTGGSVSRSAGILSRANELQHLQGQLESVQEQLQKAEREKSEARRESDAAAYELDVARNRKSELDAAVLKLEGEVGQYNVLLENLRSSSESERRERETLAERLQQTKADIATARTRIAQLESESEALLLETEGKSSGEITIRERQESLASAIAELNREKAALDAETAAAQQSIKELQNLKNDISADQGRRREELEAGDAREEEIHAQIHAKESELAAHREKKTACEEEMRAISEERLHLEARRTQTDRDARNKNEELLTLERNCAALEQKKATAELEEKQILDKLWDSYGLSHSEAERQRAPLENYKKANRRIAELKRSIQALGPVNVGAIEEFERVNERYTYLTDQRSDVERSKAELEGIIHSFTDEMQEIFSTQFQLISKAFSETFRELFQGGRASLELEDPQDILNCGIEIRVQPPGKSLKVISLLSGGEKAFVAIALYFAILKVRPAPFVVLDEIEAALDDNNVVRFARYLRGMTQNTQFIVITHRRGTMEEADVLYGVTMQEQGISKVLTVNLNDAERELNL